MAIIVEEDKNRGDLLGLLGWIGIVIVVLVAIYYIFFAAPQLVIIPPSGGLSTIAPIADVSLDPSQVINSPAFEALHGTIPPINPAVPAPGRSDPFLSY